MIGVGIQDKVKIVQRFDSLDAVQSDVSDIFPDDMPVPFLDEGIVVLLVRSRSSELDTSILVPFDCVPINELATGIRMVMEMLKRQLCPELFSCFQSWSARLCSIELRGDSNTSLRP